MITRIITQKWAATDNLLSQTWKTKQGQPAETLQTANHIVYPTPISNKFESLQFAACLF